LWAITFIALQIPLKEVIIMIKTEIDFPLLAGYIINSRLEQFTRVDLIHELAKYKTNNSTIDVEKLLKILNKKMKSADEENKAIFASYIAYVEFISGIAEEKILGNYNPTWFEKIFKRKKIKDDDKV
jgi:hypothetical protein